MAKKTFDTIDLEDGCRAYNYRHYTKEECMEEYRKERVYYGEDITIKDYYPFITYFRYRTKAEVIADGDWEYINGYEDGSLTLFEECEPNDVGAFKCWIMGD